MTVKLFTRHGGLVRRGEIPPFRPPPEVLTWGPRVFVWDDEYTQDDPDVVGYVEGLSYPLDSDEDASTIPSVTPAERES